MREEILQRPSEGRHRIFPALPKGATEFCGALRKGLAGALNQKHCPAPFRRAPQNFSRSSEGRYRILWRPSEEFEPNSKGKMEAGKLKKRFYFRPHISV